MPTSATQLPLLQRFRTLAYVLVLLAFAGICFAEANAPLFVLALIGTIFSWWLVERPGGTPLPRALINIGVLAASVGLLYELGWGTRNDREFGHPTLLLALGHFMVAILLCKLFEKKMNRDYAQILTLTLLIMVAGAIVATSSLFFAVLLAAYLALGLYTILLFHLRAETERALAADGPPIAPPLRLENPAIIRRDVRLVTTWSAFLVMAIASAAFLLFPRASGQDLFTALAGSAITTGFNDHMEMHDRVDQQLSDVKVMEVKIEQDGANIGSETFQPYFRGAALDTYAYGLRGARWTSGAHELAEELTLHPDTDLSLVAPNCYSSLGMFVQTYTLLAPTRNTLFAIAPPVAISSDDMVGILYSPHNQTLSARSPSGAPRHYVVRSPRFIYPPMYGTGLQKERLVIERNDLGFYRGMHSLVPPQITTLAESLASDLVPPPNQQLDPAKIPQIADRFQRYLRNTYPYSLHFQNVDPTLDPTADFLLNRKRIGGNCESFASAMTMMCRAVGINARVAVGYHGGEFNSIGGFYVVRERDAHAWVEVFLPQRGWTIFDPTPAASGPSPAFAIARWFREIGEVLQKAWLQTVVAFDNTSRKYLFTAVSAFAAAAAASLRHLFADLTDGFRDLLLAPSTPAWLRLLASGALTLSALLLVWLARSWYRRRTSQIPRILRTVDRKSHKQLAIDLFFFDDLLRLLGRTGIRKTPQQTPREYVENLSPALHSAGTDARWLISTFYDVRFGAMGVSPALREQILQALSRVRQELQATPDK